jgi:hypothetical protein
VASAACDQGKAAAPATGDAGGSAAEVGAGGEGEAGGSAGAAVRVPDVRITGDASSTTAGLVIRDSRLGTDASGQIRWLFTLENRGSTPSCRRNFSAKLYDGNGKLLAGSEPLKVYLGAAPGFFGVLRADLYRAGWAVVNCIPAGGRGLGDGNVWGQTELVLPPDEVSRLLAATARIEYALSPAFDPSAVVPAPDLLRFQQLRLAARDQGKVVQGTVVSSADLSEWHADMVLFDAGGRIVDVVTAWAYGLLPGVPQEFETSAGSAAAVRWEAFPRVTLKPLP